MNEEADRLLLRTHGGIRTPAYKQAFETYGNANHQGKDVFAAPKDTSPVFVAAMPKGATLSAGTNDGEGIIDNDRRIPEGGIVDASENAKPKGLEGHLHALKKIAEEQGMSKQEFLIKQQMIHDYHAGKGLFPSDKNLMMTQKEIIEAYDLDPKLVEDAGIEGKMVVMALAAYERGTSVKQNDVLEIANSLFENGHGDLARSIWGTVGSIDSLPASVHPDKMDNGQLAEHIKQNEGIASTLDILSIIVPHKGVNIATSVWSQGLKDQNKQFTNLINQRKQRR